MSSVPISLYSFPWPLSCFRKRIPFNCSVSIFGKSFPSLQLLHFVLALFRPLFAAARIPCFYPAPRGPILVLKL